MVDFAKHYADAKAMAERYSVVALKAVAVAKDVEAQRDAAIAERDALRARVEELTEALRWYADEDHYMDGAPYVGVCVDLHESQAECVACDYECCNEEQDWGDRARRVLAGEGEKT